MGNELRWLIYLIIFSSFFLFFTSTADVVTYGSCLKLLNSQHKVRLISVKDMKYGGGSAQQSVSGHSDQDDANALWMVQKPGGLTKRGNPIKCGDKVLLKHLNSERNLHSHLITSPLSKQQEVSAFGDINMSDSGDEWAVECGLFGESWGRHDPIRLRHIDTGKYLSVSGHKYNRPIKGHMEVVASSTSWGSSVEWTVAEGIFFKEKQTLWETIRPKFHVEL